MYNSEDFVTYMQAQILKELGFDWKCFAYFLYDDEVKIDNGLKDYNYIVGLDHLSAPTLSQVQKWLRENKNIIILIEPIFAKNTIAYSYAIYTFNEKPITLHHDYTAHKTYEQALFSGIDRTLDILNKMN